MRPLSALAVAGVLVAWTGPARAQEPTPAEEARALFERGLAAFDAGDTEEAEALFRRSLELRRSASAAFNLATLLDQDGRLVEALELYQEVSRAEGVPEEVMTVVRQRIAALAPRLAEELRRHERAPPEGTDPDAHGDEGPSAAPTQGEARPAEPAASGGPDLVGPAVLFGATGTVVAGLAITGGLALSIDARLADACQPTRADCDPEHASDIETGRALTIATDAMLGVAAATATAALIWMIVELAD